MTTPPLHLVCPHCNTTNRIQAADLHHAPNCGSCHVPLFTGKPAGLDAAAFDRQLQRSQIPLLVDFWAPWCGPCLQMAPAFEQATRLLEPAVRVLKINTEEQQALASRYQIRSIPTLAVFRDGREVARQAGAMGANDIVRWARAQIG